MTTSGKRVIHYLSWSEPKNQLPVENPKTMVNYILRLYKQHRAQKLPKQWIVGNNDNRWYALIQFSCKTAIRGVRSELQSRNRNAVVTGHSLFNNFEFGMAHVVGQSVSYYWSYEKSDNMRKKLRFISSIDDVIVRTTKVREPTNKHGTVLYGNPEDERIPIYNFLCNEGFKDINPVRTTPHIDNESINDLIIIENKPKSFNDLYYNAQQSLSDSARQFEMLYALLCKTKPTATKSTQTESYDCPRYAHFINPWNNGM